MSVRISCIDKGVKADLIEAISEVSDNKVIRKIKSLPECENGGMIGAEKKVKRVPSIYNNHVSKCMKKGNTMKECAVEWAEKKKTKKN